MPKKLERIYYTWDKWECYPAGFFEDLPPNGTTKPEAIIKFGEFFNDLDRFKDGIKKVFKDWPNSCKHNLTNDKMNRIAWLGQASVCIVYNIPSCFRSGYSMLSADTQNRANELALKYLNIWLETNGYERTDGKRNHKSSNMY